MSLKKVTAAATAILLLASTAAQAQTTGANGAQALSLSNSQVRSSTSATKSNELAGPAFLWVIAGVLAAVAVLEITGAINIIGDDEPDSP